MGEIQGYSRSAIQSLLSVGWVGSEIRFYETIDSTNEQAKKEAQRGAPHGALVVADSQTAGKGRRGRSWESPAQTNLYFTLILRPDLAADKASMLTLVMAHSVGRAIRRITGIHCGIKWPNDIVAEGKKVCGILTEMFPEQEGHYFIVIGVGVNVAAQSFPEELKEKATSLEALSGELVSRAQLLAEILKNFEADYGTFVKEKNLKGLLDGYQQMLVNRDVRVKVLDPKGEYEGIARGITETGELLVETSEGMVPVFAGEVSVRGVCGYV